MNWQKNALRWSALAVLVLIAALGYRLLQKGIQQPVATPPLEQPIAGVPGASGSTAGGAQGGAAAGGAGQNKPKSAKADKAGKPGAAVATAAPDTELCADAGFFKRPMCLQTECQKPANAALPLCVDTLQRWQQQNQKSQP
jgi:hypothetical protein